MSPAVVRRPVDSEAHTGMTLLGSLSTTHVDFFSLGTWETGIRQPSRVTTETVWDMRDGSSGRWGLVAVAGRRSYWATSVVLCSSWVGFPIAI